LCPRTRDASTTSSPGAHGLAIIASYLASFLPCQVARCVRVLVL
jgi:hypothetical protein